jgi:hypothetical protein
LSRRVPYWAVGWAHRRGTRLSGTRQRPSSASLLSPGPFNTAPILLMRSGFGPNLVLQEPIWSRNISPALFFRGNSLESGGLLSVEAAGIEPAPGGAKPLAESRPYLVTARNDWESLSRRVPCRPVLSQHIPQARATYVQHGRGRSRAGVARRTVLHKGIPPIQAISKSRRSPIIARVAVRKAGGVFHSGYSERSGPQAAAVTVRAELRGYLPHHPQ